MITAVLYDLPCQCLKCAITENVRDIFWKLLPHSCHLWLGFRCRVTLQSDSPLHIIFGLLTSLWCWGRLPYLELLCSCFLVWFCYLFYICTSQASPIIQYDRGQLSGHRWKAVFYMPTQPWTSCTELLAGLRQSFTAAGDFNNTNKSAALHLVGALLTLFTLLSRNDIRPSFGPPFQQIRRFTEDYCMDITKSVLG